MNNKTYIGLTIGPIFKTISNARETGELWGSSYIFSYIMKSIIYELIQDENRKKRFISPYVEDDLLFETLLNKEKGRGNKAGLFYDRFIFESQDGDFEVVKKAIDTVKSNIVNKISENINKENKNINKKNESIKVFIDNFLKIYFLEVEVDLNAENKEERNIIKQVSKYLDVLELREGSSYKEEKNYLEELLCNDNIKKSFLTKDAQGVDYTESGFVYPSISRIALKEFDYIITKGLKHLKDDQETDKIEDFLKSPDFYKVLKEENINIDKIKKHFRKAHEYVAIVQIDGDSMGNAIGNLTDIDSYKEFSKAMLDYSKKSYDAINEYGGFTVYAGGDDLLFLAPIINKDIYGKNNKECENIFQLFDKLDSIFNNSFKKYIKEDSCENPSISIGVAIVNNKYPLYFSLEEARDLLFNKAKKFKCGNRNKNAIAFKVIKSSGESFESIIGKGTDIYDEFKKLFNMMCSIEEFEREKPFLNQIHIKLFKDKVILKEIAHDKNKLKNYFINNFNEEIHKQISIKNYLDIIMNFISKNFDDKNKISTESSDDEKENYMNNIYACLKFIRFMNEKSELFYISDEGGDNND